MIAHLKRIVGRVFAPWDFLEPYRERAWYRPFYYLMHIFFLAALGAIAGLAITEPWAGNGQPIANVRLENLEVPTGPSRSEHLVTAARGRLQSIVTLTSPDLKEQVRWIHLGAEVDLRLVDRIRSYLAVGNHPATMYFREHMGNDAMPQMRLPISLDPQRAVESLMMLKERVDRPPKNASFDFSTRTVLPEENGRMLDIYTTLERLDQALSDGATIVPMQVDSVPAGITKSDLSDIDVDQVIGYFETPYSRMRKDKHRTHNVKLGARLLNGQIIMPGQVFSFNDILGDRTQVRGFRYAPVIAGGVLVEGMGGGTCQVASTLYAAAFFAGLVVADRRPHSRPSTYIKLGLDATVSYPAIDLKLKNPFDYPVAIHFTAREGMLRAEILGRERHYTTTFLRKITGEVPFPIRIIEDAHLPQGKEVITQNGMPGYTVRRYQIIERDKLAYRFQTVDRYPPTAQRIHRGTGQPGQEKSQDAPKPDTHQPYRAVPYLRMVQGKGDLWYEQSHH
ncbi:MAG: VanW family protein [Myxococcota bacterium]|nr:VanW family protein [Myxococcota bacterium]